MSDYSRRRNGFWYGYHADAHTSLVRIREVAAESKLFKNNREVEHWLDDRGPPQSDKLRNFCGQRGLAGLFAYPGQSNMNGRRLPLNWSHRLRENKAEGFGEVYTLLDAAALVATTPLDLSDHEKAPDFTALSFYRIFGFPDLGALIVRKATGHVLRQRRYFGGGTVDMVINGERRKDDWFAKKTTLLHELLEDGTPPFHSIVALGVSLKVHIQLFGSMANISKHTSMLSETLYREMSNLLQANGSPVCEIHKGLSSKYGDSKTQGPTIAFNLQDSAGRWIGKSDFETLAILNNIQLRAGGLCNPGGIAFSLDLSPMQMRENFEEGVRCGNEIDQMHGKPTGVIRISLGAMSTEKDLLKFFGFLHLFVGESICGSRSLEISPSDVSSVEYPIRDGYVLKIEETASDFICPVAACRKTVRSRDELMKHFLIHRLH